eukprot:scaffold28082_cov54-Cyclotella_meneghiniana.AAC.2
MRGFSSSSLLASIPVKEALELAAPGAKVTFVLRLLLIGVTEVLRDARVAVCFDLHRVGVVFLSEAAIISRVRPRARTRARARVLGPLRRRRASTRAFLADVMGMVFCPILAVAVALVTAVAVAVAVSTTAVTIVAVATIAGVAVATITALVTSIVVSIATVSSSAAVALGRAAIRAAALGIILVVVASRTLARALELVKGAVTEVGGMILHHGRTKCGGVLVDHLVCLGVFFLMRTWHRKKNGLSQLIGGRPGELGAKEATIKVGHQGLPTAEAR